MKIGATTESSSPPKVAEFLEVGVTEGSDIEEQGARDLAYPGMLPLDVDKYRKYVDHFEVTEQRKVELLQTLWWIAAASVKLGYGVDSLQRCIPALAEFSSSPESDELEEAIDVETDAVAREGTIKHDRCGD